MRTGGRLTPERSRRLFAGCALFGALACASPHRDLGQTADEKLDAMRSSECDDTAAARDDELQVGQATFLSEFEGLWIGHVEDALGSSGEGEALPIYAFPSGSTRILLEVSHPDRLAATLTFGADDPPRADAARRAAAEPGFPAEGRAYRAEPVARALDIEQSGGDEAAGERLAHDGKLSVAFSIDDSGPSSELHLRFAGGGLIGAFDGLSLINERGFSTLPGSVRLRRVTQRSD